MPREPATPSMADEGVRLPPLERWSKVERSGGEKSEGEQQNILVEGDGWVNWMFWKESDGGICRRTEPTNLTGLKLQSVWRFFYKHHPFLVALRSRIGVPPLSYYR